MEILSRSELFNSRQEREAIKKVRKDMGLPSITEGFTSCLCCDQSFFSEDTKTIRICSECKNKNFKEDDSFAEF